MRDIRDIDSYIHMRVSSFYSSVSEYGGSIGGHTYIAITAGYSQLTQIIRGIYLSTS